jgi:CheY-like chemotaxis protein
LYYSFDKIRCIAAITTVNQLKCAPEVLIKCYVVLGYNMREAVNFLLVEDDQFSVDFFRLYFLKKGIKNPVYRASNGVEALEILRGQNNREKIPEPYIVFLDLDMPEMSGIELLKIIRNDKDLKNTTVYILTTSCSDIDIQTAYSLNVAGFFLKKDIQSLIASLVSKL